jgi:predicted RNA polymerase sigma factor
MSVTGLIFNEGYTANIGPEGRSIELTSEAIQLI